MARQAKRAPQGSNARENQDFLTKTMSELLLRSVEVEAYGYSDLAHHLDTAAQALAEVSRELDRLIALSPEEQRAMAPDHSEG